MSTNIYKAYRLKRGVDMWKFAVSVKERGIRNARKVLGNFLTSMEAIQSKRDRELFAEQLGLADEDCTKRWDFVTCGELLRRAFRQQQGRSERHLAAFDVSLSFRRHASSWYLIPYANGMLGSTLRFLGRDPNVDFFGYWDSTDRPSNTTATEWTHRRKVWDALDLKWQQQLLLEIVEPSIYGWLEVDPTWKLAVKAGQIPKNHPFAR